MKKVKTVKKLVYPVFNRVEFLGVPVIAFAEMWAATVIISPPDNIITAHLSYGHHERGIVVVQQRADGAIRVKSLMRGGDYIKWCAALDDLRQFIDQETSKPGLGLRIFPIAVEKLVKDSV